MDWVKGSYASISGDIKCAWKRSGNTLNVDVTVPVNTTATLFLPADDPGKVSGVKKNEGILFIGKDTGSVKFRLGSGSYHFVVRGN
jgi:hypothetical protein